jgi:quercetin dioxygenase-like cupin family protein
LSERDSKGQVRGVLRISDALRKNKVSLGKGVITSRDRGMAAVRRDLKRTGMPRGVEQWLMPVVVADGNFLFFISRLKPGTKVPRHSHDDIDVLRVVIKGELKVGRVTLKPGDFMLALRGVEYATQAGPQGCTICYGHISPPAPGPGPIGG